MRQKCRAENYGSAYVRPNGAGYDFAIVLDADVPPVAMDRQQLTQLAHILRFGTMTPGLNVKLGGVVVKRTTVGYGLWFPNISRMMLDFEDAPASAGIDSQPSPMIP